MKWLPVQKQSQNNNKENHVTPRPFLVLPRVSKSLMTGGTWPPPPRRPRSRRPSTATLERPILLDIELLNKLDMSLVRKEFLCITNLCKSPVIASVPSSPRVKKGKLGRKGKFHSFTFPGNIISNNLLRELQCYCLKVILYTGCITTWSKI